MKRTNVIVDEELLERARQATGERTYSGAINKALAEYVRVAELKRAIDRFQDLSREGGFFDRDYADEILARGHTALPRRRISAQQRSIPPVKKRRGSR